MVHFHLLGWGWLSWYELFLWSINWDRQIVNLWDSDLWCEAHACWGWAGKTMIPDLDLFGPVNFATITASTAKLCVLRFPGPWSLRHMHQCLWAGMQSRRPLQKQPGVTLIEPMDSWIQLIIERTDWLKWSLKWSDEMKLDWCVAACRMTLHEGIVWYSASSTWSGMVGSPNSMYGNSCMYNVWALEIYIITAYYSYKSSKQYTSRTYTHILEKYFSIYYLLYSTVFPESFPIYSIVL